ncbi:endospore germination permease [Pontibacillus sp. HMF3514]|uniref:endospore germination permease n=1 Tax=Pontibacillus sp. HMF3514 TaxID=2692425 RepID=UPI001320076D|nr:endospore germination permease [Pontibacillus sp. HMF3514]QHE51181.1 endospore germination permease [Pontibacillus sp. HMF3514]
MRNEPISFLQLFLLIMMSTGFYNHVILMPIVNEGGRGAWVGTLLNIVPLVIVISIIYFVYKKTNMEPLVKYLQRKIGRIKTILITVPFILYSLLQIYITTFDTVMWTKVNYLNNTPIFVLVISAIFVISILIRGDITSLAIVSGVLLPIVVLLGIFVSLANMSNKDYSLLFPALVNGWGPIWESLFYSLSGAFDLVILLFLQGKLKGEVNYWKYLLIPLILTNLLISPTTGGIALFGPEVNADLRYPAYEQWRVVTIGSYISHVDYFTIYQWLSGAIIRIALFTVIIPDLLVINKEKIRKWVQYSVLIMLLLSLYIPMTDYMFFNLLKHVFLPSMTITMSLYLLFIVLTVIWTSRRLRK